MKPLQEFLDDAKKHRESIKQHVPELRHNLKKCIIYLDFTKFTIVEDGSVNCFVVSILSGPGKVTKQSMLQCLLSSQLVDIWKPNITYYDFYAQCVKKEKKEKSEKGTASQQKGKDDKEKAYKVKQIFPYVKVCYV